MQILFCQIHNCQASAKKIKLAKDKWGKAKSAFKSKEASAKSLFRESQTSRYRSLKDKLTPKGGYSGVGRFALTGASYLAAPYILQQAAEGLTGDEKIGEIAHTGTRGAIAARITYGSFKKAIGKHGLKKIFGHILKRKGPEFAAKLGLRGAGSLIGGTLTSGAVTALMAAWTLQDLQEVYKLISELE